MFFCYSVYVDNKIQKDKRSILVKRFCKYENLIFVAYGTVLQVAKVQRTHIVPIFKVHPVVLQCGKREEVKKAGKLR